MKGTLILLAAGALGASAACADTVTIDMHRIDGSAVGASVGTVTAADSQYGLLITPNLHGLTAGLHGFHVHQNPACGPGEKDGKPVAGLAAGGHFDPAATARHEGPYGEGHLGDLPVLYVDAGGTADVPVLAPRLKVADLKGHSLMIHAGGDNYSDTPASLGGGGARVACGVVD